MNYFVFITEEGKEEEILAMTPSLSEAEAIARRLVLRGRSEGRRHFVSASVCRKDEEGTKEVSSFQRSE
jgi:hypothetical protein